MRGVPADKSAAMMAPKQKVEKPMRIMGRLFGYILRRYKLHCLGVLLFIFGSTAATVAGNLFMKTLIDDYIVPYIGEGGASDFGPLLAALLKMGCVFLFGVLCTLLYNRIMVYVSQGTMRAIRDDLFRHMERLPIRYFDTHAHGDITSIYTNDIDTLRQMISQSMPQLVSSAVTIVSVFCSMLALSLPLTGLTLVMVCLMLFTTKKLTSRSGAYFVAQQRNLGTVNGYIEEMMEGQKVVKVFCHEDESIARFDALNDALADSADNANRYANILMPVMANIGNLSYVLTAILGSLLALFGTGGFTLGGLASFLQFNKSFNQPISQVSQQFNSIIMALAGAERVFSLMDEPPETDEGYVELVNAEQTADGSLEECRGRTGVWAWKHYHRADGSTTYRRLEGEVVFDDVDFGYDDAKIILHNVSLYARPGQKIAFVGATGAGKTTITNLINRFYDIADGKIRYDGINVNKIKKGGSAPEPGNRFAGHTPIHRHRSGQHPLRQTGRHRRRGDGCGAAGGRPRVHRTSSGRLQHSADRRRGKPLTGPAAAAGHCPRGRGGPARAYSGRGHQFHRHTHRAHCTGGHGPPDGGPHGVRHCTPPLHCTQFRLHHGAGTGPYHRTRHPQ